MTELVIVTGITLLLTILLPCLAHRIDRRSR